MLLNMATIVNKEIANNHEIFEEDFGSEGSAHSTPKRPSMESPSHDMMDAEDNLFAWSRARTVSIDHSPIRKASSPSYVANMVANSSLSLPAIVTPVGTRIRTPRKASMKIVAHKGKKEEVKFPKLPQLQLEHSHEHPQHNAETVHEHKLKALKVSAEKGIPITTILRKKFSWKNYPGKSKVLNGMPSMKIV
jgi:hypothetical protein